MRWAGRAQGDRGGLCASVAKQAAQGHQEIRTFGTSMVELLAQCDWLAGYGVTHVAMGATKTGLLRAGGRLYASVGQRRARQAGTRTKN
jgi:hypothetical protein